MAYILSIDEAKQPESFYVAPPLAHHSAPLYNLREWD